MAALATPTDYAVRSCQNKKRFLDHDSCMKSIVESKVDIPLAAYKCPLCGFWHKTKQVSRVDQQRG